LKKKAIFEGRFIAWKGQSDDLSSTILVFVFTLASINTKILKTPDIVEAICEILESKPLIVLWIKRIQRQSPNSYSPTATTARTPPPPCPFSAQP
jgi:hypothetical protein